MATSLSLDPELIEREILEKRHALYLHARERNPRRWPRHTWNWSRVDVVTPNPERDTSISQSATTGNKQQEVA